MKKKAYELDFISRINSDGSGVELLNQEWVKSLLKNSLSRDEEFILNSLSMSNETFIASGFNSFVVRLKKVKPMTKEVINAIYSVLVEYGGASENERQAFLFEFTREKYTSEWRFQGKLGFGGKYRSESNKVDCYPEDLNYHTRRIIDKINAELFKAKNG